MPKPTSISTEPWRPLLTGEVARQADHVVLGVAEELVETVRLRGEPPGTARLVFHPTLGTGFGGPVLLLLRLAARFPGEGFGEAAESLTAAALDLMARSTVPASLYDGFTGAAWVASQVQQGLYGDSSADLCAEVDQALHDLLQAASPEQLGFDLLGGLAGWGFYVLERQEHPLAVRCLSLTLAHLRAKAESHGEGVAWYSPARRLADGQLSGRYRLGVAHGAAGVIGFLAQSRAAGVERGDDLLERAVHWLLGRRLPESTGSSFPDAIASDAPPTPTRSAWCTGDPGIALALLNAARVAERLDWEQTAHSIALEAARRPEEETGVLDACLCHGAAGLGHLLNRLYQATGESELADAARVWLRRALSSREPGAGFAGFRAWTKRADGEVHWREDPGLLLGAAGIALALEAATSDREPAWDRVLMMSLPGPRTGSGALPADG